MPDDSLAGFVRATLSQSSFPQYIPGKPVHSMAFRAVSVQDGVLITVVWTDAPAEARRLLVERMHTVLAREELEVRFRDAEALFVPYQELPGE